MSTRGSSLQNNTAIAQIRLIDSRYDVIKEVSEHLLEIEQLAAEDIGALIDSLNEAKDFTGITVVAGTVASFDPETKIITVPTLKGDTGDTGAIGPTGPQGPIGLTGARGAQGAKGDTGAIGIQGPQGPTGPEGPAGVAGTDGADLTVEQISYNGDGTFTWQFSDNTSYTTPDLRGPQGITGQKGDKGDQGISVHHLKGTSTTDPEGDFGTFGELDTYTFYGDASETINLGYFTVRNGVTPEMTEGLGIMRRSTYDANGNGVVDNSERLEGKVAAEFVNIEDAQDIGGTKTFTSDVVIQGNLTIHGTETVVNSETVTTKDNQIVINDGEVGAGVTAGKAGIKVDRGTEPDYEFVFIEADDSFKIGKEGELQKVATREDTPIDTGLATWNASTSRFVTSRDVDVDSVSLGNGVLTWNPDEGTLDIDTGTGVIIQAGQENNRVVRNGTGSPIVNGTVVMVTGTIGNSGRLVVAPASGVAGIAMRVYGVATQDIPAGQDGYVTIDGKVRGLNTTGSAVGEVWVDGDVLYVKPNDDGNLTKVVPTYGQLKMPVANVVHAHTNGTLEVRVTPIDENAYEPSNSNIQGHIIDTSNPHGVTKAQVGLGNVDNTSDLNKIISTATQTALDLKANRIDVDDLFTDASNLGYDDTFTDMRVADVQAALAHLGEESKYWSNIHSAVRLFGGIIQDNGDGTVRVANGGGLFKKEASSVEGVPAGECEPMQLNAAQGGKLFYETWEAAENVQLTNNAYNYIFIVWDHTFDNGDGSFGKARVIASTNFYLQDWESEISYYNFKAAHPELTLPARRSGMLHGFTVGRVYKMDNEITIRVCGTNGWNFNKRVQLFGEEFFPVIRARGLDIQTIPNTLQFNVTEGVMWAEMANRFTVRAFEMDKGDTFTSWYQHTAETTALTLAQIQSTYPTGIANRKYDILYSSTDTKYYRLNPSNNTWGEVLDYINSKVSISTHPANLSELETLAPTGYVNNSEGTDYVVLQLQATDSFYRYNPNAALGNRWELFGDKSTVHPYVVVAFLGDVAGMNAQYPTGFNDVINVIVGCADGMYYEYSGVSGQSGWKRVQGYIERNGWLRFYKQSAVDALRYNDSTNNKLVDLENGMYGVAWIYMVHDNSCHVVYGQGAYTSEEAKQAALPSPLPGILAAYSTLVGKMTFSRGATTFENAESPFIEKFISSGVSLHNDLAGLDGGNSTQNRYYHLDEPAYNLVNTFADVVDVSPEGDLAIVGDYSGANALFSGNLTVGGTTSGITKAMVGLANAENTADNVKNVLSATKLTTARLIGGVSFDGSANINLPGVNTTGNQNTTGNAATATTATNVSGGKATVHGTGNDYHLGGVEVVGNGPANTVFPTIGFHQPALYASSLQLRDGGDFRFYKQGGGSYANVTADTFIGNLSGNANTSGYATTAGRAYPRRSDGADLNFYWSGQGGQPTWLWGGNDGVNMYVYNPSNFSVNYANSATYAATAAAGTNTTQIATTAFVAEAVIGAVPVSTIIAIANGVVPTGFLECNGATISRSTYSALFSKISTLYGAGDGSTTFKIPDLRGEFIRGFDNGRGVDAGRVLGSWQADEFKSHHHGSVDSGLKDVAVRNYGDGGDWGSLYSSSMDFTYIYNAQTTKVGGGETRPRNIAMMYCIKY